MHPLGCGLLVVDECSMIDVPLMRGVGALNSLQGMVGCLSIFWFCPFHAAQAQRQPPPSHPEDVVQSSELACT